MLAQLIDVQTCETMMTDTFCDEEALAAENERAQAETEGRLSWQAVDAFDLGIMTAYTRCVSGQFGGNHDHE